MIELVSLRREDSLDDKILSTTADGHRLDAPRLSGPRLTGLGKLGRQGWGHGHSVRMDPGLPADLGLARMLKLKSDWTRAVEHERLQEAIDVKTAAIQRLRTEIRALRVEQGKLRATAEEVVGGLGQGMEENEGGMVEGEEGTEGEGDDMERRGGGVLVRWREYAAWRADWRENGVALDPRTVLSCRQCGFRDSLENPKKFSGKVRKRYSDLVAGTQRHGRPIFCSTCTDNRRAQEEGADAWVASLRKTACMDCDRILTVEELSLTQRRKAFVNRRCRDCAWIREREGTQTGRNGEEQLGDSGEANDQAAGDGAPRMMRGSDCQVA